MAWNVAIAVFLELVQFECDEGPLPVSPKRAREPLKGVILGD
jgi:hypothetical protein